MTEAILPEISLYLLTHQKDVLPLPMLSEALWLLAMSLCYHTDEEDGQEVART
jgi:hypothetical protein